MEKAVELSIIMMLNKLQVIEILLNKLNVPQEEMEESLETAKLYW